MSELSEKIEEFCRQAAEKHNLFFIESKISNYASNQPNVTVIADSKKGITVDECANLSRDIGDLIDAYELFPHKYRLEVSSPGLSSPMEYDWQFNRAKGKKVKLELIPDGKQIRKSVRGILKEYNTLEFILDQDKNKNEIKIKRQDVEIIKVLPQW